MKKFKLKNLLIFILVLCTFNSCSTIDNSSSSKCETSTTPTVDHNGTEGLEFYPLNDKECAVVAGRAKLLKEIVIPSTYRQYTVTTIYGQTQNDGAFANCRNLEKITLPNTVTTIESYAFYGCISLTSIVIPDSVTTIGSGAFEGCSSLTSITLPFVGEKADGSGETHFGYIFGASSYSGNYDYVPTSLKEVIITGGTTIGERAFYDCSSLTSIVIPDSVTTIGSGAFSGCSSLTSITLPFVGQNADGSDAKHFGYIFGADSDLVNDYYVPTSLKEVIITGGTSIGSNAFYHCSSLTSIEIPDSVTTIETSAFESCFSLTSIIIPNGTTTIDAGAFAFCNSLVSIVIPSTVTTIGKEAFSGCRSLIIYCEVSSKPSGWDSYWNYSDRPVYWGGEWVYVDGVPTPYK